MFNTPTTEFVARFIGGHNVLQQKGASVALRADRLRVKKAAGDDGAVLTAFVKDVEYLGSTVNLALDAGGAGDLTAALTDEAFFQDPIEIGATVFLTWKPEDAHQLAA